MGKKWPKVVSSIIQQKRKKEREAFWTLVFMFIEQYHQTLQLDESLPFGHQSHQFKQFIASQGFLLAIVNSRLRTRPLPLLVVSHVSWKS